MNRPRSLSDGPYVGDSLPTTAFSPRHDWNSGHWGILGLSRSVNCMLQLSAETGFPGILPKIC